MKRTVERHKIIKSGDFTEHLTYQVPENPVCKDFEKKSALTDEEKISNRSSYLSVCRNRMMRLIWSNPDLNRFVTLTFSDNVDDYDFAMKEFNLFIKRLRYHSKGKGLKYIAVVEFQRRGAIHFHMLVNSYIPKGFLKKTWGCGHIDIRMASRSIKTRVYYLTKYMSKETAREKRLWGRRSFVASYNLNKPVIAFFDSYWGAIDYLNQCSQGKRLVCENHFTVESSFIGDIDIRKYIFVSVTRKVCNSV